MSRMRSFALGMVALAISFAGGCSLCCSPYNDDYTTFGSRTPRMDMKNGRVGSPMSDPQAIGSNYADGLRETFDYGVESTDDIMTEEEEEEEISLGTDR